jgi:hypothetical protein
MKTSSRWIFRSVAGKILMGLILAAMIGSIDVVTALGKDDHKPMERHDNGRSGHRGGGNDRDRYGHGGRDYQPYGYYPPPPVVYVPPPEPGIDIFLPPVIIR